MSSRLTGIETKSKNLWEKFPKGIQFRPSNFPRLYDYEWSRIGQFMDFPEECRDEIKKFSDLFGDLDTVRRIAFLYCFQSWDLDRFSKPNESTLDRAMGLVYMMATKRVFSLALFSEWLDHLDLPEVKDNVDRVRRMEEFEEMKPKDDRYALLIKFVMDDDHKTVLGTPLKRYFQGRVFLLSFFKPGVFSNAEFLEMKKEYIPQLNEIEKIDIVNMMDIIIHFDYLEEFYFTQLLRALKRTGRNDVIPRLEKFMSDNEVELKELGLWDKLVA